jgi:L-threonylcarbamoyladenylate synthase
MKILQPTDEAIRFAADALRAGELIGLPTETVYGIAASATNRDAIRKTFELKKRPADNPLIVHVTSLDAATQLASSIPESARILANFFWPGPMTLVLPKNDVVPDEATGGLNTVAVRVPMDPIALAILTEANIPVTAPSANMFMGLSPTRAEHIAPEILEGLACVVDGGRCIVGVESTVIDCSGDEVVILRPGGISRIMIESILKSSVSSRLPTDRRSPGMYKRHYSPKTPIRLVKRLGEFDAGIGFGQPQNTDQFQLPEAPDPYARELYATLYALDQMDRLEIFIEAPPATSEWEAVWDRLEKAAGA